MSYDIPEDFSGVFMFTNWTKKEKVFMWNNKEYTFPPLKTVPLIIPGETLENIQEIRKKWAFKLAESEWYDGAEYRKLSKMGRGLPPTRDDKVLQPMIDKCLNPLPIARATVKEGKKERQTYRATKAIGEKENPNYVFREENENPEALGAMSDKAIA